MPILESELILNPDGSVYHLHLRPEHLAPTVIVVGDPERVPKVSQYFDSIEFTVHKREFVTHTGYIGKKPITVISSGIGTDNVDILMNELDALVNVDLQKRKIKKKHKSLNIIRIGTSGSLQAGIPIDSYLASEAAVGLDSLMCFYSLPQSPIEISMAKKLQKDMKLPFKPYWINLINDEGAYYLLNQIATEEFVRGTTVTCPGFYAPQGREIRLGVKNPKFIAHLQKFKCRYLKGGGLTNFEMETAGYYALCRLLGHKMISLNAIVANRALGTFSKNPEAVTDGLIRTVLERIALI
jgi:uridine phosphorylase